ncbi:hypothetical protein [Longispora albida]|uniref:hypothetical protein n=1 Tax=Longispora albida TaxID=203523 RepID=UPI000373E367|nr:hypothetical protein [Longispora albida]
MNAIKRAGAVLAATGLAVAGLAAAAAPASASTPPDGVTTCAAPFKMQNVSYKPCITVYGQQVNAWVMFTGQGTGSYFGGSAVVGGQYIGTNGGQYAAYYPYGSASIGSATVPCGSTVEAFAAASEGFGPQGPQIRVTAPVTC